MKHNDQMVVSFRLITIYYKYRAEPVPGTGKVNKYNNYFRSMKTTQERRWACAHKRFVRGKRSYNNLPEPWDDYIISALYDRSWKRTKKRYQWQ